MTAATQTVTVGAAWMRAGLIVLLVVAAVLVALTVAQLMHILVDSGLERRARKHDTQPYDPETEAAITQALTVQDDDFCEWCDRCGDQGVCPECVGA